VRKVFNLPETIPVLPCSLRDHGSVVGVVEAAVRLLDDA
jgi:hypothetical protein